jgi:hypothetical protein
MRSSPWIAPALLAIAACAAGPATRPAAPGPPAVPAPAETTAPPAAQQEARSVEAALRAYVESGSDADGRMQLEDAALPGRWSVKLVRIHPLRIIDEDHWFACADFAGTVTQGETSREATADVDFHVNRVGGSWQVVMVDIHRQDGRLRERPYRCASNPDVQSTVAGTCPLDGTPLVR